MLVGKRFGHGTMQRQVVPAQNDFPAMEGMEFPQQIMTVVPSHAAGQKSVTKVDVASLQRDRDEADAGRSLTTGCFEKDRRFAERCPGRTPVR